MYIRTREVKEKKIQELLNTWSFCIWLGHLLSSTLAVNRWTWDKGFLEFRSYKTLPVYFEWVDPYKCGRNVSTRSLWSKLVLLGLQLHRASNWLLYHVNGQDWYLKTLSRKKGLRRQFRINQICIWKVRIYYVFKSQNMCLNKRQIKEIDNLRTFHLEMN